MSGVTLNGADIPDTESIMAHGDSITAGSDSGEGTGYRKFLYPLLTNRNYRFVGVNWFYLPRTGSLTYEPPIALSTYGYHSGYPGRNSTNLEASTVSDLTAMPVTPNSVVLLHIGTNDMVACYVAGCTAGDIDAAVTNVIDIINLYQAHNTNMAIYVALIIPSVTVALDAEVTLYNVDLNVALLAKQATVSNLYIVDMNTSFKASGTWETDYFTAPVEVHPDDNGYTLMAQEWATSILANE